MSAVGCPAPRRLRRRGGRAVLSRGVHPWILGYPIEIAQEVGKWVFFRTGVREQGNFRIIAVIEHAEVLSETAAKDIPIFKLARRVGLDHQMVDRHISHEPS